MSKYREAPRPNYDYDVGKLVRAYEKSLKSIQGDLDTIFLSDFERTQIVAVEESIKRTLAELRMYGDEWAQVTITKSASEGVANTIYSLGLTDTYEEALKAARFNSINKPVVEAIIADTQSDLLAVTENVERRTRAGVRQATAEVLRTKAAEGVTGTQTLQKALTKDIRERLGSAADSAIIDAAGRKWKLSAYTEMLARTKTSEAHREATRNEAIARGTEYGVISRHGATDACALYEGKVIKLTADAPGNFPYVDNLPRNDIFHPNCKHVITPVRRPDRLPSDLKDINKI